MKRKRNSGFFPGPVSRFFPSAVMFIVCFVSYPVLNVSSDEMPCNGDEALCDRCYDEVAYPGAHNAYSTEADGFIIPPPNQKYCMTKQLEDGIRCVMLDTYEKNGKGYLCHGSCGWWGQRPLADGLTEIREFMDGHPREVVTIIFESYLSEELTEAAFIESGLILYVHNQEPGSPWPTLGELIESGERLVVFTDDSAATLPWHHYIWDFAWETPYSFENISDFTCRKNRGTSPADLFILNHFLTGPLGSMRWMAPSVNSFALVRNRCSECWGYEETNPEYHIPNFVMTDHYDLGNLFDAVRSINSSWPNPPFWMEASPLIPGESAVISVPGVEPGERVYFGMSPSGQGIGPSLPFFGDVNADILEPVFYAGVSIADDNGVATIELKVPAETPPIELSMEAIVRRGPSGTNSNKSIALTEKVGEKSIGIASDFTVSGKHEQKEEQKEENNHD